MEDLFIDLQDKYYEEFLKALESSDICQEEKKRQKEGYLKGQIHSYDMAVRIVTGKQIGRAHV